MKSSGGVTLYASSKDKALELSKKVNGYRRAGESRPGLLILDGIETVDVSNVDSDFIGHSYFAERTSVLSDMFYLINFGQRAAKRFMLQKSGKAPREFWVFRK